VGTLEKTDKTCSTLSKELHHVGLQYTLLLSEGIAQPSNQPSRGSLCFNSELIVARVGFGDRVNSCPKIATTLWQRIDS